MIALNLALRLVFEATVFPHLRMSLIEHWIARVLKGGLAGRTADVRRCSRNYLIALAGFGAGRDGRYPREVGAESG